MDPVGHGLTAHAEPSKDFFTETLTRDITLSDSVLDLVDNSIHSAISKVNVDVSEHLFLGTKATRLNARIDIAFNSSKFTMSDDCGGISIEEAQNEIFRFGNPVKEKKEAGLGVYGIGMKRAFFKIGRQITIAAHTTDEEFGIDIDVDVWRQSLIWEFPFTYARERKGRTGGTDIEITSLHPTIAQQFVSKAFKSILLEKLSRVFALFLKAGLQIKVNGDPAGAELPELAESSNLRTVRHMLRRDGVDILIMAGLSPKADRKPRGWYVFCNGRMVLDADKTEETGWGTESFPGFHVKYNHFLGYVYFRSKDMRKLPWKTTKEGVDRESPIYQAALAEMRVLSRPVLDFLNELYEDVRENSGPERELLSEATAVAPDKVASRGNSSFRANIKKKSDDALVSIQYKRPKRKLDQINDALKKGMSAARIGEYTFDWFYDRNCK